MMLVGRFLQGFGASGPRVMVVALVRDCFSGAAMARTMSFAMTLFMAVPIMAPLVGQGILLVGPWQWIFGFYVVFAAVMFAWVYVRLDETLKPENRLSLHPKKLWHTMVQVLVNPHCYRVLLCGWISARCLYGLPEFKLANIPTSIWCGGSLPTLFWRFGAAYHNGIAAQCKVGYAFWNVCSGASD